MSFYDIILSYFVLFIGIVIDISEKIWNKIKTALGKFGNYISTWISDVWNKSSDRREKFVKNYKEKPVLYSALFLLGYIVIITILSYTTRFNFFQQTYLVIVTASNLILASVGLTLTTRVRKFANFAHSEFLIIGIYVAITIREQTAGKDVFYEWIFFELIIAFIITGIIGVLTEVLVFGPLVKRNATPLSLMVASIGIGMVIRQTIQEIYGAVPTTAPPQYPDFFDKLANIPVLKILFADNTIMPLPGNRDIFMSRDEIWAVIVMIVTVLVLVYLFKRTTLGISMRATADDPSLAQISGINTQAIIYWTWFIAAGVTGMGALFFFEAAQVQPGSGFAQLLIIFAVVTLGGFDSFEGTLISGFIISFTMTTATILNSIFHQIELNSDSVLVDKLIFWSTTGDWKLVAPFAIIIVVLLFRPRGIFGLIDPRSKL